MNFFTRETLLYRLKNQSDEDAWKEFAEIYRPYICKILIRMELSNADVDDINQTVLLKAWEKLPEFDYNKSKGKFRHWLAAISINAAKNFLRQKNRLSKVLSGKKKEHIETYLKREKSPEIEKIIQDEWEAFISQQAWDNVQKQMSPTVIDCFRKVMEGMSISDTAKHIGISENTVYVYNKRVKNTLCNEIIRLEQELE